MHIVTLRKRLHIVFQMRVPFGFIMWMKPGGVDADWSIGGGRYADGRWYSLNTRYGAKNVTEN